MSAVRKREVDARTKEQTAIASDPAHSAWVSANAGSGKTYVLAQRVVRLLLAGCDPSRILCLTFTKAAAGEMSNRVFKMLGEWTVATDAHLREALTEIEGKAPTQAQLDLARTLFAKALETPGGLKIQTIHAFCEALLHQFPLEANVPGSFDVMDDAQQKTLLEDARRRVWLAADREPKSDLGRAFGEILDIATDSAIESAVAELMSKRDSISNWLAESGGPEAATQAAKEHFGFDQQDDLETLRQDAVEDSVLEESQWRQLMEAASAAGQSTATKIAENASVVVGDTTPEDKLDAIASIVLKADGDPRQFEKYPSNPVEAGMPGIRALLEEEADRLKKALGRIATFRQIENTKPLLVVGEALLTEYRRAKSARGLLDFDDLVSRTADLLSRGDARQWVLYKLDLGIDHVLLDEAQDTSPRQWEVITQLVEEFFQQGSAREANRTVFAVGDEKQSIYSFQGAEPESFAKHRRKFSRFASRGERSLKAANLNLSFRSTVDVLAAVDTVFLQQQNQPGIAFEDGYPQHSAERKNDPGTVEVWPLVKPDDASGSDEWHVADDPFSSRHQAEKLAAEIAADIDRQVENARHEASGKKVRPGDIVVLVRARDRFVTAITRALKNLRIKVAGADRLVLTDHIAVLDLLALGQVMVMPQDDLSLAALLKSPLFGMSEDDLFLLARQRVEGPNRKTLFEALQDLSGKAPFSAMYQTLTAWLNRADRMPVYEFYARILGAEGGRKKFYERLGSEAEDVLDAFLDLTLEHEQSGLPGLQAFVEDLAGERPEIKREFDVEAGEVRVMTVHAAKGLEAPIVYLVDKSSAAFQGSHAPALYRWGEAEGSHGYLWVPSTGEHGDTTTALKEDFKRKAEEEYRRLLYVGMTRAKERLIVCGYRGAKTPSDPNWHAMVSGALNVDWEQTSDDDDNPDRHIWKAPDSPEAKPEHHEDEAPLPSFERAALPGWIGHDLPRETALPRPLNPSGAQALIEESLAEESTAPSLLTVGTEPETGEQARRRGTALHTLLQVLPVIEPTERRQIAQSWLQRALPDAGEAQLTAMLDGVLATLNASELAPLFDPATSRAEVPVMGRVDLASGPRSVSGTIDRLAVLPDRVVIADYKTSQFVPRNLVSVPKDYITQMALYRVLLARLYPQKPIEAILIWTHAEGGPATMTLPSDMLDDALAAISRL